MNYPLERFGYTTKDDVLREAAEYWNPHKTAFWIDEGIPLVIGDRAGYVLTDLDGHELIDVHLNGGTYNLGHRNPRVIAALTEAMSYADVGNHHFPAVARTALARELVRTATPGMSKVVFGSSGGETIDVALKSARWATKRRKVVSIVKAFHGHTGLAVATGDDRFSQRFLSDRPDEFVHVPFNDIEAMRAALAGDDVAAVIVETIPATYGFPMPAPGYLAAVAEAARAHGALYIADEVQTGLGRTGTLWAIEQEGVAPDIIVTGKGLGGGIYPVSAAILGERAAGWLSEDGFAHMGTFGGSELGSVVALEVLRITTDPETVAHVTALSDFLTAGLVELRAEFPDVFVGIRQKGLVIGLEFDASVGAQPVMRELYANGVWAIFSTLDPRVLQFKPGLLLDLASAERVLGALRAALVALTVRV